MSALLTGLFGRRSAVVGDDIAGEDISEFYFTYDASTYPPEFQRYRLFKKDGRVFFYHEKREGDHWPLREEDATVTGTTELTGERFFRSSEGRRRPGKGGASRGRRFRSVAVSLLEK